MPIKVLISTPVRRTVPVNFLVARETVRKIDEAKFAITWNMHSGSSVADARNMAAYDAISNDYDKMLFIDDDMAPNAGQIERILSRSEPVVGGVYTKKRASRCDWLFVPAPNSKIGDDGLLECTGLATGFMCVDVSVLKNLYRLNQDRMFHPPDDPTGTRLVCELFPNGVVGPATAEGRLDELKRLILEKGTDARHDFDNRRLMAILTEPREPGMLVGEDYYFCRLARRAGYKVYADIAMPLIPHIGPAAHPITPDMVGLDPRAAMPLPPAHAAF